MTLVSLAKYCLNQAKMLHLFFVSLRPAVIWEAGFPCWHASSFVQPALSSGERWTHQPPGCCWLRPGPLHAHPGTAPTAPLSDSTPPPAAGRTGRVYVFFRVTRFPYELRGVITKSHGLKVNVILHHQRSMGTHGEIKFQWPTGTQP